MICLLESILMISQVGAVSEWANDGQRFLLEHFDTIQSCPSHIYHSALPLSPSSSWLYRQYIAEASPMVKVVRGPSAGWGVCSRTTLFSSFVRFLSHHGNSIAVGPYSQDIIILNVITGSKSAVLSGHKGLVNCVVFSSDGTSLVSGGEDKTIKLWDIQTGGIVKTFFGHTSGILSVSISADSSAIVSGSHDKTICLWNIQTVECYCTIQQQDPAFCVTFALKDPHCFMSVSNNKVWQWYANGCQINPPFDGSHVAFSSDGAQFVSCFKETITVYNSNSGAIFTQFQAAGDGHWCCFSPCNRLVAVAVNKTAYCWDITTSKPQLVETFIGHTNGITSLIFSSSTTLISASSDHSVKFWQIGAQLTDPAITDLEPTSLLSAPIKSVILQSKEYLAFTCDSDGIMKVWDISTGTCRRSSQTSVKYYTKWDAQVVNGRFIFVWCGDGRIHALDVENGGLLWEVFGPSCDMEDLRISGDGSRVFGLYKSFIWTWSILTGDTMGTIGVKRVGSLGSLIVDGSKVWAYLLGPDCTANYKGWDVGISGSTPVELSYMPPLSSPNRLFSPRKTSIKSPASGEVVFKLSARFAMPSGVQWDDSYLVAGYQSGEVLILDLTKESRCL